MPEACAIFERVISTGLISLLSPNIYEREPAYGAIEVFMVANGPMRPVVGPTGTSAEPRPC